MFTCMIPNCNIILGPGPELGLIIPLTKPRLEVLYPWCFKMTQLVSYLKHQQCVLSYQE